LAHRKLKGRKKGKGKKPRSTRAQIQKRKLLRKALMLKTKAERKATSMSLETMVTEERKQTTATVKTWTTAVRKSQKELIAQMRKFYTADVQAKRKAASASIKSRYKLESAKINAIQ